MTHKRHCLEIQVEFIPVQLDAFSHAPLQEFIKIVVMFFDDVPADEHVISNAHNAREALECF